MNSETFQPPQTVAKELNISSASLRRWSDEFTEFLSKDAGSDKDRSHRRYSNDDVGTLLEIKELMNNGMTYEQVRQQLKDTLAPVIEPDGISDKDEVFADDLPAFDPAEDHDDDEGDAPNFEESLAVVAANGTESPAMAFLNNTLTTLSDSQKSILNSQAANRELMGVLLQDNFNLKEENNRLRERILEVERDIARSRQEEEWRREALRQELEAKISAANQLASEAIVTARSVEPPQIKAVETKPGCLGMLLGRGGRKLSRLNPVNLSRKSRPLRRQPVFNNRNPSRAATSYLLQPHLIPNLYFHLSKFLQK